MITYPLAILPQNVLGASTSYVVYLVLEKLFDVFTFTFKLLIAAQSRCTSVLILVS